MKFSPLHASLLTLALFAAGPAQAAATSPEPVQLAQAETGATADFDAVTKFLAGTQDVSRLDEGKLQQRLKRARKLRETEGLPPDLDQALQQRIAELEAEIARRSEAAQQAPAPEAQPQAEQSAPEPQPQQQAEQPAPEPQPEAQQQAEQPAPEPQPEAQQQAEQPAPQPEPQPQAEQPAQQETAQAQAEQPTAAPEQPAAQEQTGGPESGSAEIAQFLASVRPAAELSEDELRQQMRRATELAKTPDIARDQRKALREVIREARAELRNKAGEPAQAQQQPEAAPQPQPEVVQPQPEQPAAEQATQQPAPAEQPQVQQQAKPETPVEKQIAQPPQVDPALEQQARAILDDKTDVRTLKRRELRQRLGTIRDLLATNQLSVETREALRAKLAAERQVLRREVAVEEGAPVPVQPTQPAQPTQPGQPAQPGAATNNTTNNSSSSTTANTTVTNNNVTINNNTNVNNTNTDVRVVLKDRRPADELADDELVRRIDVYRDVVNDDRYDEEERIYWQRQMERDRRYLRSRMIEERRQREAELRRGDFAFNVQIEDDYEPGRDVPDDVFAAEVDDEEITDVLVAPPRRQIKRQYSVEEIERSPEARNAVARIEIDTVHFGFGEGFLREEEIDKLDRIAQVLEKILAKHPEEVFLLEGHTDAVGSDAANLKLSRQRAQAVKEALTTYYVIPAENLKTVGLGERYLKIPTLAPEAENRRVSLARITPLVGRAD